MSIALAFKKSAAEPHNIFGQAISAKTGSIYCHVECWISGPQNAALCFSSREPHGAGWATIDLTDAAMWDIVPLDLTPEQEIAIHGFCCGCDGKRYDALGIVGIAVGADLHDYSQVFCSEVCASMLKQCAGKDLGGKHAWQIWPGELYEMATTQRW